MADKDELMDAEERLLKAFQPGDQPEDQPGPDDETEADEVEVSESDEGDDDFYEVPVNGETRRVKFDDLVRAYQRNGGTEKALQEAAVARKEAEALREQARHQAQQHVSAAERRRQELEQRLSEVAGLIGDIKEPDPSSFNADPIGYMEQRAHYDSFQKKLMKIRETQQQIQQQRQQDYNNKVAQWGQAQHKALLAKHPELEKPEEWTRIASYVQKEYGISAQELQTEVARNPYLRHHSVWSGWFKAAKRDEALAKQSSKSGAVSAPRTLPPGTAKRPGSVATRKLTETRARLVKDGSVESATDHLVQLLGKGSR